MTVSHPTLDTREGAGDGKAAEPGPIDLAHLARQTLEDKEVEREVLALFAAQARDALGELARADAGGRQAIAHRLLGAARAIGAHAVAETAQLLEAKPADHALAAAFRDAIAEAEAFIAGVNR